MTATDGEPSESEEKSNRPVDRFRKELSTSGGSNGVSLHFDADFAEKYGLVSGTEVDVEVVERNGDVMFEIGNIPAGFTLEDLEDFADKRNWKQTDRYVDSEEWYLTYRNNSGNVRIEIDSEAKINGNLINNIAVEGEPIEVTGDLERYNRLCAEAQRKRLRVRVDDSKGLWQRLRAFAEQDTDDAPDEKTFQQISEQSEVVTAQLVCHRTSLKTSLQQLGELADTIEEAYQELQES